MTDDEREVLAAWLEREAYATPQARVIAAQLRSDGERIKALEEVLRHVAPVLDGISTRALQSGLVGTKEWDNIVSDVKPNEWDCFALQQAASAIVNTKE